MTIKEIAVLANTSRGTVDRVVNNRGKVRKEVEARILKVIQETNYVKNELGRSLSNTRKFVIGAIIGSINNSFFSLIIDGIAREIEKYKNYGFSLVLKRVNLFDPKSVIKALDELDNAELSGLIITALDDKEVIDRINKIKVPVVCTNVNLPCKNLAYVGVDYKNCGSLVANFANLVLRKDANVAIVVGSLTHNGQRQRIEGFKSVIRKDVNILDIRQNYDSSGKCHIVVNDLIKEYNDKIDYIIFFGSGSSGGIRAIRDANMENHYNIKAITVDQSNEIEKGLQEGIVSATITQHPYTQGVKSVDIFYDYFIRETKIEPLKIIDNSVILKESYIPHKLDKYED